MESVQFSELSEREQIIYLVIRQNPRLNQNKLKKIVCEKLHKMAGTTFERNLKSLLDNKMITFEKYKNQKLFSVTKPIPSHEKPMLEAFDIRLDRTKKQIENIENKFSEYSKIRKNTTVLHLLKNLQNLNVMLTAISSLFEKNVVLQRKKHYEVLIRRSQTLMKTMHREGLSLLFSWFNTQSMLSEQELQKYIDANDSFFELKLDTITS